MCKESYADNPHEQAMIREFERDYRPQKSIWWYTRDSCLYRILNKALRLQDIDLLFSMRFLIKDISQQLKDEHRKFIEKKGVMRVYRGQAVATEEIDKLRCGEGQLISFNNFLSTSLNRDEAVMFARQIVSSNTLQRVFFEIKVDTRLETRAFADITDMSFFHNEQEVLFTLGSVFRLENVMFDDREALWCVKLTLCNEDDQDMKDMYAYQKKSVGGGDEQASLLSLGFLLHNMGEYGKAKQYYTRVLFELGDDDINVAVCHQRLGEVSGDQGEYDVALDHLKVAVKLHKKFQHAHDTLDIANCYYWIGHVHREKEEYETALSYLNKDLAIKQAKLPADDVQTAMTLREIGNVHYYQGDYDSALSYHQRALVMYQKVLPPTHSSISASLADTGNVYLDKKEYDRALDYYNQSLQFKRKSLPPDHPNVATTYYSIGCVYEEKNDSTRALEYFEKCLVIRKKSLPPSHPDIQWVSDSIQRVQSK
ncbi:unnamed protein product [Didymodactylos carnosus]|uniref:ADP ribosyltransferase domain-containing protein n=1 Tax=Didymodactylos carnosus TaxID=1234261 RepID=A0A813Q605_9BILA|nr:unnamed protein product [Didymodactylos carnosus]CAF3543582.1 unnamed protein product [Didymodactylos carnosus]